MSKLIDRFLHLINYRHPEWRAHPPRMMRWHNGRWESREPTPDEEREMFEDQAYQF